MTHSHKTYYKTHQRIQIIIDLVIQKHKGQYISSEQAYESALNIEEADADGILSGRSTTPSTRKYRKRSFMAQWNTTVNYTAHKGERAYVHHQ